MLESSDRQSAHIELIKERSFRMEVPSTDALAETVRSLQLEGRNLSALVLNTNSHPFQDIND